MLFRSGENLIPNYINNKNTNEEENINHNLDYEYEYIENFINNNEINKLQIEEFEISYEPRYGKFILYNFRFSSEKDDIIINTDRWFFFKDKIRLIDKIGNNTDLFNIVIGKKSLSINPNKIYLNLDFKIYSDCF